MARYRSRYRARRGVRRMSIRRRRIRPIRIGYRM